MERLTKHYDTTKSNQILKALGIEILQNECIQIIKCENELCSKTCERFEDCEHCPIEEAICKLAAYEDAEEQGLLLRLPIAEGTIIYLIDNNTDACFECEHFVVGHCCEDYCSMPNADVVNGVYPQHSDNPVCKQQFYEVSEMTPNLEWIFHNRSEFGKTWFLTETEAKAALKKMQEGE